MCEPLFEEEEEWTEEEPPEEGKPREEAAGFVIRDDQAAEWCLRRIRDAEAEKARWEAFYEDRKRKALAAQDARIARLKHYLEQYFWTVPHQIARRSQSYRLPGGKLVIRSREPKYDAGDPALVAWLRKNKMDDFVEVRETAKWGELRKTLPKDGRGFLRTVTTEDGIFPVTADGEIVPGVRVTPRDAEFIVEI